MVSTPKCSLKSSESRMAALRRTMAWSSGRVAPEGRGVVSVMTASLP